MTDERRHEGFTPGPWEATNDYAPGVMTSWDVIAPGPSITVATGLTEANARLMADAPRLLAENEQLRQRQAKLVEALELVQRRLSKCYTPEESDTLQAANAALAAARGEG